MNYSASAPATFMIAGEHAVLHNHQALVAAASKRLTVSLRPRHDTTVLIQSDALGEYCCELSQIAPCAPFQFILAALKLYQPYLKQGCHIQVNSEFSHTVGFGSSAAVTVATIQVLREWLSMTLDKQAIFDSAFQVLRVVQSVGSGADLAASIHGGLIAYRREPFEVTMCPSIPNLNLIYVGYKVKTVTVIEQVSAAFAKRGDVLENIYKEISQLVNKAKTDLLQENWSSFYNCLKKHQQSQQALGVSNTDLEEIIALAEGAGASVAKISGSGLGDCILSIGHIPENLFPANLAQQQRGVRQFPVTIDTVGIHSESCHHG